MYIKGLKVDSKPDFKRFKKVLLRDGEPDIIPFSDFMVDAEIIRSITGKQSGPESNVEFFYKLGYDFVPEWINFGYKRQETDTRDAAPLSRGMRTFVNVSEGRIINRDDFDSFDWPLIDSSVAASINRISGYMPDDMKLLVFPSGGILDNAMLLMGYVPFSYALYDDEQLVWDLFERIGENHMKAFKTCFESVDMDKIGAVAMADDMGFNQGTLVSPDLIRQYVLPWHKKIVDLIHSYDLPMILHACGNVESIMEDLIDYVGIDARHSFQDVIMPVTEIKKRYGNRIAILGGVDVNFLCMSDEMQIRQYVDHIMEECTTGGGYALGTGNSVTNYIPLNNYLAMLDEGRKYSRFI